MRVVWANLTNVELVSSTRWTLVLPGYACMNVWYDVYVHSIINNYY